MSDIIVKKGVENITLKHKYDIIDDYIYSTLTNPQIAEKYGTSAKNVGLIISRHFKALANVRETKALISEQDRDVGEKFQQRYENSVLNTDKINEEFLQLLSEPDSITLTDNEMVFCELINDNGDEIRALEESGLSAGLKKTESLKDREQYSHALTLRSFYLRRKPNVAKYLLTIQQDRIKAITDGKSFIQTELLAVIERLKAAGTPQSLTTYLKAVDSLARTYGAFEDKMVVESVDGDSALEKILMKAKRAKEVLIEQEPEGEDGDN